MNTSAQPLVDVASDPLPLLSEGLRIIFTRSSKIATVTASVALSELPEVILFRIILANTGCLPGIVGALGGDDVDGVGLDSSVDGVEGVGFREEVGFLEHAAALFLVVGSVQDFLQAEGVVVADLPPGELSAALGDPRVTGRTP